MAPVQDCGLGTPHVDTRAPTSLSQPLPPQSAPLPGIYLNTVPAAKAVYLTAEDTLSEAIPLHQVQHMAMGPPLTDTNKPRNPLQGRGAPEPRPKDPNAPGPDRALLYLTMKPGAQLPTTLEGEKHFIVEGHTDEVITPATNSLAAVKYTWDDAVGHPTERKDRIQEKQDTLAPELMDQLVQHTSPPDQHVP